MQNIHHEARGPTNIIIVLGVLHRWEGDSLHRALPLVAGELKVLERANDRIVLILAKDEDVWVLGTAVGG
jgi:hypothetical protein